MRGILFAILCLACSSSHTNDEELFGGGVAGQSVGGQAGEWPTGGAAGSNTGGVAGVGTGGVAGASSTGGAAGAKPFCQPGEKQSCECWEGAGHQTCNSQGSGYDVCRNEAINSCCGSPTGWPGCVNTGCGVCSDLLTAYPKYLQNHPNCFASGGCIKGQWGIPDAYGPCNSACPEPGETDK